MSATLEQLQQGLAVELNNGFGPEATVLPYMPATIHAMSGYLRFEVNHVDNGATYRRPTVSFTLVLYGPTHDFPARQQWLIDRALSIRTMLADVKIAGQKPPKMVSWRIVSFVEDAGAIGVEVVFAPVTFHIPED